MNHKDNRRTKLTRQILKDSLLELLETESIHKISIRSLCETADVNRSTFYKYYGSQYDLLKEMEDDLIAQIEKNLSKENASSVNKLEEFLLYAQNHRELCTLLLNSNVDPDFPKRLLYLPIILDEIDQLITPAEDPVSASYLYDCILYGGFQMVKRWVNEDCKIPPHDMALMIENTFRKLL